MKISTFFDDVQESEQYDYKILVYGNYTYRSNLEADSFVEVLKHIIPYVSGIKKVHFTVLVPEFIKSLDFPNVTQEIFEMPTYPNQMRTHFDSTKFLKIIDWKHNDFDIVYSHLPEHTSQISNCIYNNTHLSPKIIGYSHWFEVPENTFYSKTMFMANIAGILEMEECGVNSEWLKNLILEKCSGLYSSSVIKKLESIIQPHYLGVDSILKHGYKNTGGRVPVMFNHRANQYTGWNWFSPAMDELWEKRQDFIVYTTLIDEPEKPWQKKVNFPNRDEYIKFLNTCKFGIGAFQEYSAWSISTTDGLAAGVPYLLPNKLCYPEMIDKSYPYLYNDKSEFISMFETMISDDLTYVEFTKDMLWLNRIQRWFNGWGNVFKFKKMNDTDGLKKVVQYIKKNKIVSKQDLMKYLGWGVQIKWSDYRNALREHPNIKFTKTGYEWKE